MKGIKVIFTDDTRDFCGWTREKVESLLLGVCNMIKANPQITEIDGFSNVFDNALKIFALFNENLNGIYCAKVRAFLLQYNVEGYFFINDLINKTNNSIFMNKILRLECDKRIMQLIRENNKLNRTTIAELISNTEYSNLWIEEISKDIEYVHMGEKTWEWFYEKHCNDELKMNYYFEDDSVQEIFSYFNSDEYDLA